MSGPIRTVSFLMTYEDKVQVGQLIENDALACRDADQASDGRQRHLHVFMLGEKGIVGADCGGNGLDVEEEGSVEPRKGSWRRGGRRHGDRVQLPCLGNSRVS